MADNPVLIVGAGPTGLVLALWLSHFGIKVRLIDCTAHPGTTSRALAVQARTLEFYQMLGFAQALIERGHRVPAVNLWVAGERRARLPFMSVGEGLTPFSFLEIFPQDEHERLLIEQLGARGVQVERRTQLTGFTEADGGVRAQLLGPDGGESVAEAAYIAGCDGARSKVREILGTGFPGGTYRQVFYVADIEGGGPAVNGELNIDLDEADFLAIFPLKGEGRARLVGTVRDERAEQADTLKFADVSGRAIRNLKLEVAKVNWFSTYHVHHRVTEHFSKGRAFLLGDAAHIHSPVGGQGMNTGIGDAVNLAWKLAAVLKDAAPAALLESYEAERQPFARRLVATTDRAFSFVTAEGPIAEVVRTRLAPLVLSRAVAFESVREFMFRTVSQIMVNYRGTTLSAGAAGAVHGGDRLPWAAVDGVDNFDSLRALTWQVHVYGRIDEGLQRWCQLQGLRLQVYGFADVHHAAGLVRDGLYLLRPDGYVALASERQDPQELARYLQLHGLKMGGT